uniref:Neur_chan_LBD domain-containing protein n=1 Tax=Syphacia muris TaxID=451379 RepID=A0A0N5ADE5_9BILA
MMQRTTRRQDTTTTPVNTSIITDILNRLTDPKIYDKRLRPGYGGQSTDVGITIHVSSISAVSEVNMVSP